MTIYSKEKPAIFDRFNRRFGVQWEQGIIIAYKDTVYCKYDLPEDFKVHEETHLEQQKRTTPDEWIEKYLTDAQFRLEQEVEAYTNQIAWAKKNYDRPARRRLNKEIVNIMMRIYDIGLNEEEVKRLLGI